MGDISITPDGSLQIQGKTAKAVIIKLNTPSSTQQRRPSTELIMVGHGEAVFGPMRETRMLQQI